MSEEEFNKLLRRINYYLELQETDNFIYDAYDIFGDDTEVYQYMRYTTNLQQENKQLKEKLKWYEKENKHNQEIIVKDANILTELEKQLKEEIQKTNDFIQEEPFLSQINNIRKMSNDVRYSILSKIQELKEKYK